MKNFRYMFIKISNINENQKLIRFKDKVVKPIARFLIRLRIRPTGLNLLGLILGIIGSIFLALGDFKISLLILLFAGLADALDGTVARELGIESPFGTFLDATLDRYVDSGIFIGISIYYIGLNNQFMMIVTLIALVGAYVTSYTAAKASSLGINRYIGFLGRPQRVILLLVGIVFPKILSIIIWILAILGNLTAIYRIVFYLKALQSVPIIDQKDQK